MTIETQTDHEAAAAESRRLAEALGFGGADYRYRTITQDHQQRRTLLAEPRRFDVK